MKKIPAITTKIANETLEHYFKEIEAELRSCDTERARKERMQQYRIYIENEAQKTKSTSVRMQLRINMRMLHEKFEYASSQGETVLHKQSLDVPLIHRLRLAHSS